MNIDFEDIKTLFDETWDVGILSADQFKQCLNYPIKRIYHPNGTKYVNDIHYKNINNVLILIKDGHTWDYTHYDQATDILKNNPMVVGYEQMDWEQIYINFKESAILAGLGVRARNSLIYSYKFGFDCHITAFLFHNKITNTPTNKRVNRRLWPRCKDCYDCVNACPVKAIHGKEEPFWLDASKCDNFIGVGDHSSIPSVKTFWHKHVHPEVSQEIVDSVKGPENMHLIDNMKFDANGYSYDGQVVRKDSKPVNVPFCRECTSQPRCSKWNGNYPYEDVELENFKVNTLQ